MPKKPEAKTVTYELYNPPKSLDEAAHYELEIIKKLGDVGKNDAELAKKIAGLKDEYKKKNEPHFAEIFGRAQAIHLFANPRKKALIENNDKKTISLGGAGDFRWYDVRDRVAFKAKMTVKKILANIEASGLMQFIRPRPTVDKQALLADRVNALKVEGIRFVPGGEYFSVRPSDTDSRIVRYPDGTWDIITEKRETQLTSGDDDDE